MLMQSPVCFFCLLFLKKQTGQTVAYATTSKNAAKLAATLRLRTFDRKKISKKTTEKNNTHRQI